MAGVFFFLDSPAVVDALSDAVGITVVTVFIKFVTVFKGMFDALFDGLSRSNFSCLFTICSSFKSSCCSICCCIGLSVGVAPEVVAVVSWGVDAEIEEGAVALLAVVALKAAVKVVVLEAGVVVSRGYPRDENGNMVRPNKETSVTMLLPT